MSLLSFSAVFFKSKQQDFIHRCKEYFFYAALSILMIPVLDIHDAALERVAKAKRFSLHAGVSCEGQLKEKCEGLWRHLFRAAGTPLRFSLSSIVKGIFNLKTGKLAGRI